MAAERIVDAEKAQTSASKFEPYMLASRLKRMSVALAQAMVSLEERDKPSLSDHLKSFQEVSAQIKPSLEKLVTSEPSDGH